MPDEVKWIRHEADDPIGECLSAEEFDVLAQHHERERWVWEQMAKRPDADEQDKQLMEFHRDAVRNYRELSAQEEQEQTEYEQQREQT